MYKALTYIVVDGEKRPPGSKITKAELQADGQTDANITQLINDGALSTDMKAELHEDHQPITLKTTVVNETTIAPGTGEVTNVRQVIDGDGGSGNA